VLLALVGAIALWERRPVPRVEETAAPVAQELPAATKPTAEALAAAAAKCARKSAEEFRRAWGEGTVSSETWTEAAAYASHYNARMETCFYLLTIARRQPSTVQGAGAPLLTRKMLFDVNEGELYGEYRGPETGGAPGSELPATCRVVGLYCASRREWDRLADAFMEPDPAARDLRRE